jgi:UDP-glucuronate 4-epimerase
MRTLVTGAAGFIGSFVTKALLARGDEVTGVDNLNAYYDPSLKEARLRHLQAAKNFTFVLASVADREAMQSLFEDGKFDRVIHLAAEVRERNSLDAAEDFVTNNITGFLNILEGCRHGGAGSLVYASSCSVYGANRKLPHCVRDCADHPLNLYAASKKSNELMAHVYAQLCGLPVTGLRFFSVYGPWGRPDMAAFVFTRKILAGEPIDIFNYGGCTGDFTYIDDAVDGVLRAADHPAQPDPAWNAATPSPATSSAPYRLYNVGAATSVELLEFIGIIEGILGRDAKKHLMPMDRCDVEADRADIGDIAADLGYAPKTAIEAGLERFISWYREYYRV